MKHAILAFIFSLSFSFLGRGSHAIGGDITWTCEGGDYVFQLTFFRDCNGSTINPISELIDVWGHPTIATIELNFVSRIDISPICNPVAGSPTPFLCGSGNAGGNGVGALEKIIYRSNPISLTGVPPPEGWSFTYQNFSRNMNLTNLVDPELKGITISSTMFAIPGAPESCVDNSPQFLQDPYFVSCVGDPYAYNMNAVDPDLDSLAIRFATPLDYFPGQTYNPPTIPAELEYASGFSFDSPTPGISMNTGNVQAQVHSSSGNITFLSNNSGSFAVKIIAESYRNGVLIASIDRELQVIVQSCSPNNQRPVISGPFGGLFETTVNAGDLVNFNLSSVDVEILQDGITPQSNLLTASGLMFGSNYVNDTGCSIAPCATLNSLPPITMPQGVSANFNWQTSCDHLVNTSGDALDEIPYYFVFKIQDDFCDIPKVTYATVTVHLKNPGVLQAPEIQCIQTDSSGNVTLDWEGIEDTLGTFVEYHIYSVEDGLIGTISDINTTTFTHLTGVEENQYFLSVISGCNGNTERFGDTLSNISLALTNPGDGTAVLQWNNPSENSSSAMSGYYHIYREYPSGIFNLYDSVPFGTNAYIDTIEICEVSLNYQIVLQTSACDFTSNSAEDQFEDMMTPEIPIVQSISMDTTSGNPFISWNENSSDDTYGYVIYIADPNGIIVELDTVWGISTTGYSHITNTSNGPLTYSVAAFDSCWTDATPPTYQTSAKAEPHTSIFVSSDLDICARQVQLTWTDYVGWVTIDHYEIYYSTSESAWQNSGSTTENAFTFEVEDGKNYCFAVKAVSSTGEEAFSNKHCVFAATPGAPQFNYLRLASVESSEVLLRHYVDLSTNIQEVSFQRKRDDGVFQEIRRIPATGNTLEITDKEVNTRLQSYTYRVQLVDSCSELETISNEAETILLEMRKDPVSRINYLQWNAYREFDGSILGYNLYREDDLSSGASLIATLAPDELAYEDHLNDLISYNRLCYTLEALESVNTFGFAEVSRSNVACTAMDPLIYIPNAFVPDGINTVFRPVLSDVDLTDYEMTIYDRLGRSIFTTTLYDEGWDGKVSASGKKATTGTYIYQIKLKDGNGETILKRGHVSLLK